MTTTGNQKVVYDNSYGSSQSGSQNYSQLVNDSQESSYNKTYSSLDQSNLTDDDEGGKTENHNCSQSPVRPDTQKKADHNWMYILIVGIICIIALLLIPSTPTAATPTPVEKCSAALTHLKEAHPEQDMDVIKSIASASKNLLGGKDSFIRSIVLLHTPASSPSFIGDILNSSIGCTITGKSEPIVLGRDDFTLQMEKDPGHVLVTFGEKLKREGIMLIRNVHMVPEGVAQAFHTICDSEYPWAKPAAIYFTIEVPTETRIDHDKLDHLAVRMLRDNWRGLPANILDPLITRITDQVLFVK